MNINQLWDSAGRWFRQNSPRILTGIGISSMFASVIFAVKETPKAEKKIEEVKKKQNVSKLSVIDIVKCSWKYYIPSVLTFASGTGCVIAAMSKQEKRTAASAALCSFVERSYAEYRQSVIDKIGERKESAIQADIAQKQIDEDPPKKGKIFQQSKNGLEYECEVPQEGKVLCRFNIRPGRYFYCNPDEIKEAKDRLNAAMGEKTEPYVSVNDFFYECGLPPLDPIEEGPQGESMGWNLYYGFLKFDIVPGTAPATMDNGFKCPVPCENVIFQPGHFPRYDFMRGY